MLVTICLVEVRSQPAFRGLQIDPAPRRIILKLIAADPGDAEILAVGMAEIEARDRRRRQHREAFRQRDPGRARPAEQIEQQRLEAVIGAGGITRSRTDAAILLFD